MQMLAILSPPFEGMRRTDIFLPSLIGLLICLAIGVLFGLLLKQGVPHPYDKLVHITFFMAFSCFALTLFKRHFLLPLTTLFLVAALSEIFQGALPYREMSYLDMVANFFGIALASFMITSPRLIAFRSLRTTKRLQLV